MNRGPRNVPPLDRVFGHDLRINIRDVILNDTGDRVNDYEQGPTDMFGVWEFFYCH